MNYAKLGVKRKGKKKKGVGGELIRDSVLEKGVRDWKNEEFLQNEEEGGEGGEGTK